MKILPVSIALLCLIGFAPMLHAQDMVDPKRAAAAEELLSAMHIEEMMSKIMGSEKQNVMKMASSLLPKDTTPEQLKKIQDLTSVALDTVFKQLTWDSLKPDFIQIYADVFTEQELKDLTAFYKTPIGQKFIEKMPELQAKTMEVMQKRMITLLPEMRAALKDAIEKAKAGGDSTNQSLQPPPQPPQPPQP